MLVKEKKPLNTPIAVCGAILEFDFICTFVIDNFSKIPRSHQLLTVFVTVISRKLSQFNRVSLHCIDGSSLFRMSKNSNDSFLALNLAQLSSTNLSNVSVLCCRLRARVKDLCSIIW